MLYDEVCNITLSKEELKRATRIAQRKYKENGYNSPFLYKILVKEQIDSILLEKTCEWHNKVQRIKRELEESLQMPLTTYDILFGGYYGNHTEQNDNAELQGLYAL